MEALLSASDSRKADRHTIDTLGISEAVLMEHAALAIVSAIENRFHRLVGTRGLVVGGLGNNGGDAFAVARLANHWGAEVTVVALGDRDKRAQAGANQLATVRKLGIDVRESFEGIEESAFDWVVDGIFGTGLSRDLDSVWLEAVRFINTLDAHIVSIDVPSGLDSDSGIARPEAVHADQTVALGFYKKGLVTGLAADFVGRLRLATIQIPRTIPNVRADGFLYSRFDAQLPPRPPVGHKGLYGHLYVVCGEQDKEGAAGLVALAGLRCGAGLVTVVGEKLSLARLQTRLGVDLMTAEYSDTLFSSLKTGAIVIGPGLGRSEGQIRMLTHALKSHLPIVLDADAVILCATHPELARLLEDRKDTVLTPHPKEAAAVLGVSVQEVQNDRFRAAQEMSDKYGVSTILKGKGTILCVPGHAVTVVTAGCPALSKAGTGDVLSGAVGTFLAQGITMQDALPLGVYLHGRASEIVAESQGTERAALASEIAAHLSDAIREVET